VTRPQVSGGRGIRTHGTSRPVQRFSRPTGDPPARIGSHRRGSFLQVSGAARRRLASSHDTSPRVPREQSVSNARPRWRELRPLMRWPRCQVRSESAIQPVRRPQREGRHGAGFPDHQQCHLGRAFGRERPSVSCAYEGSWPARCLGGGAGPVVRRVQVGHRSLGHIALNVLSTPSPLGVRPSRRVARCSVTTACRS